MKKSISSKITITLFLCLAINSSYSFGLTKGDYAELFCRELNISVDSNSTSFFQDIRETKDKRMPYIAAMNYAFPHGEWTGKQWLAHADDDLTREMVLKSFTIYSGIPLIDPEKARKYVNEKITNYKDIGFSDDMFLYIGTLLDRGLNEKYAKSNEKMNLESARNLLKELNKLDKSIIAIKPISNQIYSNIETKQYQEYYPDGPVVNYFTFSNKIDENTFLHQYVNVKNDLLLESNKVGYAVGNWSNVTTKKPDSKIVASFLTVSGVDKGSDSQLVGTEIDVINYRDRNKPEKHSTVGAQIVTIGTADSTAAVEVISDWSSRWRHGILFDEGSMSEDGTIIAVSQEKPMKTGIDLGNSIFSDSALRIRNNQIIKFEPQPSKMGQEGPAYMKLSEESYFTIFSGKNGFVIKSNDNSKNLLRIDNDGNIYIDSGNIVLNSPSGKKFSLHVDDAGKLITEKIE